MHPLPYEFKLEIEAMLGQEAPAFFAALEKKPTLALRLNPLRKTAEISAESFISGKVPWANCGFYLKEGTRPGAGIAHAAGAFYLQEASAMVSVSVLRPQPGERILLTHFDKIADAFFVTEDGRTGYLTAQPDKEAGWGWTINNIPESELFETVPYAD